MTVISSKLLEAFREDHKVLGQESYELSTALRSGDLAGVRRAVLAKPEATEAHIVECGELFEALGGMPSGQQDDLYRSLIAWRKRRPRWSRRAASPRGQPLPAGSQ